MGQLPGRYLEVNNFYPFFQGGYPAKLKKVLIVTAPLWFKAPFKILRLFVREKLRERVYTVSVAQLLSHIPRESLPTQLGGSLILDHNGWLSVCLQSMTTRAESPLPQYGEYQMKNLSKRRKNYTFRYSLKESRFFSLSEK